MLSLPLNPPLQRKNGVPSGQKNLAGGGFRWLRRPQTAPHGEKTASAAARKFDPKFGEQIGGTSEIPVENLAVKKSA